MDKTILNNIVSRISSDDEQYRVLKSDNKRIMVEAPPGYGKTNLLINKTIYDLYKGVPKNHEKVLMITFSVNSVSKMEKDFRHGINSFSANTKKWMIKKIDIRNFHGFV